MPSQQKLRRRESEKARRRQAAKVAAQIEANASDTKKADGDADGDSGGKSHEQKITDHHPCDLPSGKKKKATKSVSQIWFCLTYFYCVARKSNLCPSSTIFRMFESYYLYLYIYLYFKSSAFPFFLCNVKISESKLIYIYSH